MMISRLFFWMTDRAAVVCEGQRSHWQPRGVLSGSNEVICNGVDTEEFCDAGDPKERAALRGVFGFSDACYVIGVPAFLLREKNHLQLVGAISALRNPGIPALSLLIADREKPEAVVALAAALHVER